MFTIIGGDGKEYGPVTTDQVRSWMAQGRASVDTRARAVGSEEWRRLGDFPEFGGPSGAPPVISPATGPVPGAAPADVADRGRRLAARIIDWVISWLGMAPGMALLGNELVKIGMMVLQGQQPDFDQLDTAQLLRGGLVMGAGWLLILIVQVVLLSTRGQSIGKILCGIRVVRVADGTTAGFLNAWLMREALISVISFVLALFPFVGVFLRAAFHVTDWCFIFRPDQRCLHDLMAGTKVVRVTPR